MTETTIVSRKAAPHAQARLSRATSARGRPRRQVRLRPTGRVRRHRAPRQGERSLQGSPARAAGRRPRGRGDEDRLPGDGPLHRRLRRRPAPRRDRPDPHPAQRDRRDRRRGDAHPGELGDVQPAPAPVRAAADRRGRPEGAARGADPARRARGAGGRLARPGGAEPVRGLHDQPAGPDRRPGQGGRGGDRYPVHPGLRRLLPPQHRGGRHGEGHRRGRPLDRPRPRRRLEPDAARHRPPRLRPTPSGPCARSTTTAGTPWSAGCAASPRPPCPRRRRSCGSSRRCATRSSSSRTRTGSAARCAGWGGAGGAAGRGVRRRARPALLSGRTTARTPASTPTTTWPSTRAWARGTTWRRWRGATTSPRT